jgi:hypothetical protein
MYYSGEIALAFDGYLSKNLDDKISFVPIFPIRYGISEWVNIDVGYAKGVTLGLKCRIFAEKGKVMPSVALGVHNLFTHKEATYFSVDSTRSEKMDGEIFLAFSKSIENIKTRFHLGIQSIPKSKNDKITFYSAIEKYFGLGLYSSLELYQRNTRFHISLFANWRIFNNHFEISAGAVELKSMFFDKNNKFSFSLAPSDTNVFVKPGIWFGIKYHGHLKLGKKKGFISIEDQFNKQEKTVVNLKKEVDSLNKQIVETEKSLSDINSKINILIDSMENDPSSIKNILYNKLVSLKTLYHKDPFNAENAKIIIEEILSYREKAVSPLLDFLIDKKNDREIRVFCASLLGDLNYKSASDVLLDILAQTNDPDIKIEILISLGKMHETRAMYLMEQLANSPNDAIAITAQDVLNILTKETGAELTPNLIMRKINIDDNLPLQNKQIGEIEDITGRSSKDSIRLEEDTTGNIDSTLSNLSFADSSDNSEFFKEEDIPVSGSKVDREAELRDSSTQDNAAGVKAQKEKITDRTAEIESNVEKRELEKEMKETDKKEDEEKSDRRKTREERKKEREERKKEDEKKSERRKKREDRKKEEQDNKNW